MGGLLKKYHAFLLVFIGAALFTAGFTLGHTFSFPDQAGAGVLNDELVTVPSREVQARYTEIPSFVDTTSINFELFWDVWKNLEENYYKQPVSDSDIFYGAVGGIVSSVDDPYTVFFPPKEAEEFSRELEGRFEGIGAEIGVKQDIVTVIAPLPDSPAEEAGLLPGDKIFFIDGQETRGMTVDAAVSKIRGEKGTTVILTIMHKGESETREISIVRDEIIIKTVSSKLIGTKNDIGYLRVFSFTEDTADDFGKEVRALIRKKPKGIVLDLRSNPGGFLDAAVEVASFWVKDSVIVKERFSDGGMDAYQSVKTGSPLSAIPTVLLVNDGSASASEIVAGALKDYGKATIVGVQTFGKGNVQDYSTFSDGSALKITIAEWLTPNDTSIHEKGINPDITVEMTSEDYNADRDPQLDRALELLR